MRWRWARSVPYKGHLLDRAKVEAFKNQQGAIGPVTDHEGTWYPECLARTVYPNTKGHSLRSYLNKSCPAIGGHVLRAKRIPRPVWMKKGLRDSILAYLGEDLEKFKEPDLSPFTDEEGEWIPLVQSARITELPARELMRMSRSRSKSCWYLDGRVSVTEPIPETKRPLKRKEREGTHFFLKQQCECIAKRRAKVTLNQRGSVLTAAKCELAERAASAEETEAKLTQGELLDDPTGLAISQGNSNRTRKRPAAEKHARWISWREGGLTWGQIAKKETALTGKRVSKDTVRRTCKRKLKKLAK